MLDCVELATVCRGEHNLESLLDQSHVFLVVVSSVVVHHKIDRPQQVLGALGQLHYKAVERRDVGALCCHKDGLLEALSYCTEQSDTPRSLVVDKQLNRLLWVLPRLVLPLVSIKGGLVDVKHMCLGCKKFSKPYSKLLTFLGQIA